MAEKKCPLTGDGCWEHGCRWYTQVIGTNPQTGAGVDHFDCAVAWLPILLIENSQQSRQTGAAVESFRNEVVKANEKVLRLQQVALQQRVAALAGGHDDAPRADRVLPGD